MQNEINIGAKPLACREIADVAFDTTSVSPFNEAYFGPDLVQIFLVTSGKIVEAQDVLVELEQGFEKI